MKKNNLHMALALFVLSTTILSACGSNTETGNIVEPTAASSQMEAGETKADETIVETVEPTTVAGDGSGELNIPSDESDGPGFHMKETENNLPSDKAPNSNNEKEIPISIYVPSEGDKGIYMDFGSVKALDAQAVTNQLVEYKVLPDNSTVLGFEIDGTKAKLNLIGIDLGDNRKTVCIANTFIENFNLDSITIVAGDETSKKTEDMHFAVNLKEIQ